MRFQASMGISYKLRFFIRPYQIQIKKVLLHILHQQSTLEQKKNTEAQGEGSNNRQKVGSSTMPGH